MSDIHSDGPVGSHVLPKSVYVYALVTLLFLTFVTVAASRIDFGEFNFVVAFVIASIKAGIVGLFFMHLKYENPLIWLFVMFPLVVLFLLIGGTFTDPASRPSMQVPPIEAHRPSTH
jgi:cytochrome c oxidase subunit IV